jgi:prophage DNA circulation protein
MTYPDRTNEKFQNMGRAIVNREIKIQELTAEVERMRAELRLARAVIHELAWGPDTITDRPRLRDALKAWGEADKADLPPEGE